jgi:hypothetical protein
LGFGQRLGLVCLHLIATCTFSVSLCVPQSSPAPPPPVITHRDTRPSRYAPTPLHPKGNKPPRPHPTIAARPNPNPPPHSPPETGPQPNPAIAARLNPDHPPARPRSPSRATTGTVCTARARQVGRSGAGFHWWRARREPPATADSASRPDPSPTAPAGLRFGTRIILETRSSRTPAGPRCRETRPNRRGIDSDRSI